MTRTKLLVPSVGRLTLVALAGLLGLLGSTSCYDPPQFLPAGETGGPQGVLSGTVTYSGPLPCTESGHVLGSAVLFAFDARLLPPPDGLGTSASSLAVVPGDTLFGGITDRLTFNPDGSKWCPPTSMSGSTSTPAITASADWSIAPLPGAVYEVRGFYDLAGTFDPSFSITKLPVAGDIAGGAIDNVAAVLQGAAPSYRKIQLGSSDGKGGYSIPANGAAIDGVTVTFGLPLATELPIFNATAVAYSTHACSNGMVVAATPPSSDPTKVTMPSDYMLPVYSDGDPSTEDSIIRMTLTAGVPASETKVATASPYDLPVVTPTPSITFSWQDVNGDGMLDITHDHPVASDVIPSLYPLGFFTKLASPTDDLTAQAAPVVIMQGLTLYKNLTQTLFWTSTTPIQDTAVVMGVIPAAICIDPTDFSPDATATLVLPHFTDCTGNPVLTSPTAAVAQLSAQFGRPVKVVEACLPQGRYSMSLVYPTGQAWTVPNEAGVCQALEPESADGTMCVAQGIAGAQRTLLKSQDVVLTVGPPSDASYCAQAAHKIPAACCPAGGCP